MRRFLLMLTTIVLAMAAVVPAMPPGDGDLRLIVLIAVDQFRYDYLTRFRPDYHDGFKRLLTDGAVFTDANLEHYPTVTAVGHATMLSGATPAVSGIIGNDWYDRGTSATVTSVSDPTATAVGADGAEPASPRRLLVSTVGDELKMASRAARGAAEAPRVIGVSLKDRSAILPAGRGADAAYWLDTKSGRFVTSSYYVKELPAWAAAFNARNLPDSWAGQLWTLLASPTTSRRLPAEAGPSLYQAVYNTPFGNDLLVAFAKEALEREQLGRRGATDLLTVSFSSTDAVGHTYGPDSPEVKDIAVRTDRHIGQLLSEIDRLVGLDHVIVALTADHGVAPLPEMQEARHMPGGRMANKDLFDGIQKALVAEFGPGNWIVSTAGTSPYFNDALVANVKAGASAVRQTAARAVATFPHVARVYTRDQLQAGAVSSDRIGQRILRGFNAERSGDLEILLEPYWLRQVQGTTHGTPYNYDAHIPLILMGSRIQAGEFSAPVALNDLAPTLATLAGVEIPSGSVGRVLTEALKPRAGSAVRAGTQGDGSGSAAR